MSVSLVVKSSFILRPFLLERRRLPLCELQLILWLEKSLQHVITIKEFTLKKICRKMRVWTVWEINEILRCNWNVQQFKVEIPSKNVKKNRRHSFNFNRAKVFNRTSYDNPKPKLLFFEKQIEWKRGFLILAFKTLTQNTSLQYFSVIPKSKLEVLRPHVSLKFSNFKSWVSLSRYRYNCKQYKRRMEYMHYLRTQSRFKLCMQLADSVQYVIDVLVREKMLPYLCLWPSYVNFYREEKSTFWGYQIKNWAP